MKGYAVGGALLGALLLQLIPPSGVRASTTNPPPPPTPPGCKSCGGPPPPPTPVPTIPPTVSPSVVSVAVRMSPSRVRRGQQARLTVTASVDNAVTVVVRYRRGKPVTYHGKISGTGTYVKSWKIPKAAPLGKATLQVTVKGVPDPYRGTIPFEVIK
jgi:hypothetical protein